jgi:hypothetical protein
MKLGTESSTIDALVRMEGACPNLGVPFVIVLISFLVFVAAGLGARSIADKLNDPNRPTWDQYKKNNADALEMGTKDIKDMIKYRQELDAVRQDALAKGVNKKKATQAIEDSDEEAEAGEGGEKKDKKDKKKKDKKDKKKKKDKKHKKDKKRKREDGGAGSDEDDETTAKFSLSNFMNASDSD